MLIKISFFLTFTLSNLICSISCVSDWIDCVCIMFSCSKSCTRSLHSRFICIFCNQLFTEIARAVTARSWEGMSPSAGLPHSEAFGHSTSPCFFGLLLWQRLRENQLERLVEMTVRRLLFWRECKSASKAFWVPVSWRKSIDHQKILFEFLNQRFLILYLTLQGLRIGSRLLEIIGNGDILFSQLRVLSLKPAILRE